MHACRALGLMTFSEQPTILFVPLECRYVTAASVPQLQSEASATRAATDNELRGRERQRVGGVCVWGRSKGEWGQNDGKRKKVAGH